MGYTDAHGRPEIEPGAWFGTSPPQLRRRTTAGPAGAVQQSRSGRDDPLQNDDAEAVTEPRGRPRRTSGAVTTAEPVEEDQTALAAALSARASEILGDLVMPGKNPPPFASRASTS